MEQKKKYERKKIPCPKCGQPMLTTSAFCKRCTPKAPPKDLDRNMAIYKAAEKKSLAEVAREFGLTRQRVHAIVKQQADRIEAEEKANGINQSKAPTRNNP